MLAATLSLSQRGPGSQRGRSTCCATAPWQVFAPESGQEKLYTQAIAPIVEEVLEGFNCTIFACAAPPLNVQRTCLVDCGKSRGHSPLPGGCKQLATIIVRAPCCKVCRHLSLF